MVLSNVRLTPGKSPGQVGKNLELNNSKVYTFNILIGVLAGVGRPGVSDDRLDRFFERSA
jgi:hypothetical protein